MYYRQYYTDRLGFFKEYLIDSFKRGISFHRNNPFSCSHGKYETLILERKFQNRTLIEKVLTICFEMKLGLKYLLLNGNSYFQE